MISSPARFIAISATLALLVPATAMAGVFTPVSQSRVLTAGNHLLSRGFTCWETVGLYTVPSCPETLEDTHSSDDVAAPDLAPFSGTASLPGASVDHNSTIGASQIALAGTASAEGAEAVIYNPEPGYTAFTHTHDRTARDESTITMTLDEATPYLFQASGRLDHPQPSPLLGWDAALVVTLDGPGGEVARFEIQHGGGCANVDFDTYTCWIAPSPLHQLGTLPPGQYTLTISLQTEGDGGWDLRFGDVSGFALGEYDVALTLDPAAEPVPLLGPAAVSGLALALGGVGGLLLRRRRNTL